MLKELFTKISLKKEQTKEWETKRFASIRENVWEKKVEKERKVYLNNYSGLPHLKKCFGVEKCGKTKSWGNLGKCFCHPFMGWSINLENFNYLTSITIK